MNLNKVLGQTNGLGTYGQIDIDAEYFRPTRSSTQEYFSLIVSSITFPGLQIQRDSSFILKIDSIVYVLYSLPDRYYSEPVKMAGVHYLLEKSTFEINKDILERIGNSKSVSFIIRGKERVITGTLSSINISRFKSFYQNYVGNNN